MTTERYTKQMFDEYRKEQDEKAATEQRERQEAVAREAARRKYLRAGGTEQEFAADWPQIRREQLRKSVGAADEQARDAQRGLGISAI